MSSTTSNPVAWGLQLSTWTRVTLIWLMAITVTGAAVRLTGSGLGCTDWPTCSVNTELDAPGFHSAVEFGNRIISGLAIIPVIGAWVASRNGRRDLTTALVVMVVGFLGQVLLGMLVTRTELDPRVVLGHFLLSIVLIFIGAVLDHHARNPIDRASAGTRSPAASLRSRLAALNVVLGSIVIVVGTLVTGSGPHTGSDESGEAIPRLGFAIRDITRVHSLLAWALLAGVVFAMWRERSTASVHRTWLNRIGGLAVLQGMIGYLQYATGVPVGLVAVHIAGSVVLWTALVWYALVAREPDGSPPGITSSSSDLAGVT